MQTKKQHRNHRKNVGIELQRQQQKADYDDEFEPIQPVVWSTTAYLAKPELGKTVCVCRFYN